MVPDFPQTTTREAGEADCIQNAYCEHQTSELQPRTSSLESPAKATKATLKPGKRGSTARRLGAPTGITLKGGVQALVKLALWAAMVQDCGWLCVGGSRRPLFVAIDR